MKRGLLIISVILLGLAARAQSVTYSCRYWFDQNHTQAVTTNFSDTTWQAELDVGQLSEGLHTLHLHVMDTSMKWSAPRSFLFLKVDDAPAPELTYHYWFDQSHSTIQSGMLGNGSILLDVAELEEGLHSLHVMLKGSEYSASKDYLFLKTKDWISGTPNYICHYWFDQNFATLQSDSLGSGNFLLNVEGLEEGMHTLNVALQGNGLTPIQSYMFIRAEMLETDSTDMSQLTYRCWFDQDFEHLQTDSLRDGNILLDVDDLTDGLHTVNVLLEGATGTLTTTRTYMFVKVAVDNPSVEQQYRCWFDQDYSTLQTGFVGSGLFELEVGGLTNGIHTVNVQLYNDSYTVSRCHMFYKRPVDGYICKWEYWLNDDTNNQHTTDLSPYTDSLSIIDLLPMETQPIRSSCFHFQPNGDDPYIIAKNKITFRFWDVDRHFIDKSAFYIDENVVEPIVADTLERNMTTTIATPDDNQIHWFKLAANRGDYLSFQADKACTMQLFAPSGEEIYAASGPESIVLEGFNVWENGIYYLAVHDVTGSGETVSVTYNWLNRYAIVSYDVHLVGNGGCSTITFQGNGFNSLLDAYLVNWQNDTIRSLDIGHESNTTTTVSLNFYQENLGVYDAVFEFFEETIRINGALEVQEPVDILLTSSVSYPSVFLRNTPCTYTFTITNEGNMTAYNVPIYVYIGTEDMNGLYSIHIDGLETQSYYDCVKDLYEWSELERKNIKEYSDLVGVDYCFVKSVDISDNEIDSILIRSGNFYIEIPPYTTRTISLRLISYTNVDTWFSHPNECLPIIEQENRYVFFDSLNRSSRSDFCCWHTSLENVLNGLGIVLSIASIILQLQAVSAAGAAAASTAIIPACPSAAAAAGAGALSAATLEALSLMATLSSCTSSSLAAASSEYANDLCNGKLKTGDRAISVGGIILGCLSGLFSNIHPYVGVGANISSIATGAWSIWHNRKSQNPYCNDGESKGGKSNAVNSLDPNDIYGYLSESGSHYMRQEIQNVQYEIEFENDTTLATAAAHTIIVRDTLDATKFDLNSLAARSVTIGDKRLDLNGEMTFARTLDLRPDIYVIAQVEQEYDATSGIIQWTIQSLDPMTMEPTDDPNQGVLPVNYFGNGVGFIDYSVDLKETFEDGTEISNRAGIIFDQNDIIMTPTWTNIVDAVKPTSQIDSVELISDSLSFHFVSSDNRSGVWYHTLYYRNDSTEMQWQVKKPQIIGNNYKLKFDDWTTTEYLVMAVDSAGNHEEKEMVAEYTYYYDGPIPVSQASTLSQGWNWWSTYIELDNVNGLQMLENSLGEAGIRIQSRSQYTDNYGTYGWYGPLNAINNEQSYRIRTSAACSAILMGQEALPESHPITINNGWSWIGYPSAQSASVSNAMSGFTPEMNDQIKSRHHYTTYYGNNIWYGTLNTLEPGQGYMYKSNATTAKTLVYQTSRDGELKPNTTTEGNSYQPASAEYADNMTLTAVLELDGEELRSDAYELAAFVGDECRGSVKLKYVEPIDRYVAFLLVYGDVEEEMNFVLTDGSETRWGKESVRFAANGIIGKATEPYVLHFGDTTGVDDAALSLRIYPNPVACGERFSIGLSGNEAGTVRIEVVNALGVTVATETAARQPASIAAPEVPGVYTVKLLVDNKTVICKRLIVR